MYFGDAKPDLTLLDYNGFDKGESQYSLMEYYQTIHLLHTHLKKNCFNNCSEHFAILKRKKPAKIEKAIKGNNVKTINF